MLFKTVPKYLFSLISKAYVEWDYKTNEKYAELMQKHYYHPL